MLIGKTNVQGCKAKGKRMKGLTKMHQLVMLTGKGVEVHWNQSLSTVHISD
jgi:hypothetical protein